MLEKIKLMDQVNHSSSEHRDISEQTGHIDLLIVCPHLGDGGVGGIQGR